MLEARWNRRKRACFQYRASHGKIQGGDPTALQDLKVTNAAVLHQIERGNGQWRGLNLRLNVSRAPFLGYKLLDLLRIPGETGPQRGVCTGTDAAGARRGKHRVGN